MSGQSGTIWLTGLSGAGKTTTAQALRDTLVGRGQNVIVIDGDDLRRGLSRDLGFSASDRDENVRRAGEIAIIAARQGATVIVSLISPRTDARRKVRARHSDEDVAFAEVFIATPIAICEARDGKSLYQRARAGENIALTGVDDPYEAPEHAEITVSTEHLTPTEVAALIVSSIGERY